MVRLREFIQRFIFSKGDLINQAIGRAYCCTGDNIRLALIGGGIKSITQQVYLMMFITG